MIKIRYEVPLYTLFFGLLAMGLYFGVIWLREWADPVPNLAIAMIVTDGVRIEDQPIVLDIFGNNNVYALATTMAKPGYVAVYEPNGELVGVSRFIPAGSRVNARIELTKKYDNGQTLIAKLHKDNGDGIFNLVEDFSVKDKSKKEIAEAFRINGLIDNSK